tara:strand:- start:7 stop:948 length:942 start_codon:yes stop_codon:yes gene_type:complete
MKIDSVDFVLNTNKYLDKSFYFISGNETSFIEKVKDTIINYYKTTLGHSIKRVKNIESVQQTTESLFHKKELALISDLGSFSEKSIELYENKDFVYVFILPNSPKVNTFKRKIQNNKNSYLLECYSLSKEMKIRIVNFYCEKEGVSFDEETFWFLIESLDERYKFLENDLDKVFLLDKEFQSVKYLKSVLTRSNSEGDKIFFNIYKDNDFIINAYRDNILDQNDLSSFFYTIKNNIFLIIYNDSIIDFEKKIPRYLFKEKNIFLKIYKNISVAKKKKLTDLIYSTEKNLRQHRDLNLLIGLRFFLNLKKIIIS